jgi:hypothetical protein
MVRYQKLTIPFRILVLSLVLTIALEIFARFLTVKFKNNAVAYHLMSANGYIFFPLIYCYLFKNKRLKRFILISIPVVITFFLVNLFLLQQPSHKVFPTNIYLVTNSLYVIFSLLLFKQMLQHSLEIPIVKQSPFWFNTAMLYYSTTMFLHMAFLNYYVQHGWGYDIIFYLYGVNYILFYSLTAVALFVDKKEHQSKTWELMT